ncbi:ATP-binding protein [Thalassobacillus pellis]|uniref:ATP-binding protein n=1 Tax=Thalassobacillus pellis TaxID=748008 RepID=UPI00195F36C7|nr:ATP-binding protein [Thalassobacillus pellis]MBM7552635.1 PAS domain S-box-containing protein [Thalassobacillus pellis]
MGNHDIGSASDKNGDGYHHPFDNITSLPDCFQSWFEYNSNDLITVFDVEGKIKFVSKSVQRWLGYEAEEIIGSPAREIIHIKDHEKVRGLIGKKPDQTHHANLLVKDREGRYILMRAVISKKYNPQDDRNYILSVAHHITDNEMMQEQILHSEKMTVAGQLAASVAHEIRNPLTSLKGFLQLLQAGIQKEEEYYKIMLEEIDKMEAVTSELLFVSKPMTDERGSESLKEMLEDVITLMDTQAKMQSITMRAKLEEGIHIFCDRSQIKQVFINIIKNAIEAMQEGGLLEITTRKDGNRALIDVIDEGPGIPEDLLKKITEPFFTTKKNGTGLGLMISNQILDKHNGFMKINSNPNIGTTFRLVLPAE